MMTLKDLQQRLNKAHALNKKLRAERERLIWALTEARDRPEILWLFEHRAERMDALVPMFDPKRAQFHIDRYLFAQHYVKGKKVVDIASGTGYGSSLLIKGGASQVWGFDQNKEAVSYSIRKYGQDNLHFLEGDAQAIPLPDESVEAVVSFETIEHVKNDQVMISEIARILKPEGTLIISTPNQWPLEISPHHIKEYNFERFSAVLTTHFKLKQMFNQNSGSTFKYNHEQKRGIVNTTPENSELAECFIAIARKS